MKHKTADLEGALLDAAVAKADGFHANGGPLWWNDAGDTLGGVNGGPLTSDLYCPSSDWQQGGQIIERERISVTYDDQGGRERGMWNAYVHECSVMCQSFDSPLIAAMRAYCASKFGDEVELP